MRTYLDCSPCFLRQALEAARMAGADTEQQRAVLLAVLDVLQRAAPSSTPPQISRRVHDIVRQAAGVEDPYRAAKERSTHEALALYPWLGSIVADADDPLETAVRLSIAGNIIDMGPDADYDLRDEVERVLSEPFTIDEIDALSAALDTVDRVLYLADNAGETVFDRLLIQTLHLPVTYAVKGSPIINDATREDARAAGVDQVADVISNGSNAPGTDLKACSDDFRRLFGEAELIIAKGQANYETLSEEGPQVFFLLQTKCPIIAQHIGVPMGSLIVHRGQNGGSRSSRGEDERL